MLCRDKGVWRRGLLRIKAVVSGLTGSTWLLPIQKRRSPEHWAFAMINRTQPAGSYLYSFDISHLKFARREKTRAVIYWAAADFPVACIMHFQNAVAFKGCQFCCCFDRQSHDRIEAKFGLIFFSRWFMTY